MWTSQMMALAWVRERTVLGTSFHTAPSAPPIPPSFERSGYLRGSRVGSLRREPSPDLQRNPALERGNAMRSLQFPAPAPAPSGAPGLHRFKGYAADPLLTSPTGGGAWRCCSHLRGRQGAWGDAAEEAWEAAVEAKRE